mmetsp:Transcript_115164/g.326276  ORF Transcript_115164/g.326276 Transcript_115164/m.326276 type:complete len:256 (+) Transcript_115164:401-1168(+)
MPRSLPLTTQPSQYRATRETNFPTPSSALSCSPREAARCCMGPSVQALWIAAPNASGGSFRICFRPTPTPSACTRCAWSNWSRKQGVMTVGTPARSAAIVVPAPPWCTVQATSGKSHSWDTPAVKNMFFSAYSTSLGSFVLPLRASRLSPAQPLKTTARPPQCRSARAASSTMWPPPLHVMLPQPMYTGGSPSSRNWRRRSRTAGPPKASGSSSCLPSSKIQNPVKFQDSASCRSSGDMISFRSLVVPSSLSGDV